MRDTFDENRGIFDHALLDEECPEVFGIFKLLVDLDGLGNFDTTVCLLRRVVQLAQRGVTRSGIVPCVRAFKCDAW